MKTVGPCGSSSGGSAPRYLDLRFSVPPDVLGPTCRFRVRVGPRKSWRLTIQFVPAGDEPQAVPARHRARRHRERVEQAPRLETDSYVLREAYARAVEDFSALYVRAEEVSAGDVWIAAGIPWLLALFGRNSLITAYQALRLYPDVTREVLRTLARYQGRRLDRRRDEEPGKILPEYRYGVVRCNRYGCPPYPYYGTVDATPLFFNAFLRRRFQGNIRPGVRPLHAGGGPPGRGLAGTVWRPRRRRLR